VQETEDDEQSIACEAAALSFAYAQVEGIHSVDWETVQHHDQECVALVKAILNGFPSTKAYLPTIIHPY